MGIVFTGQGRGPDGRIIARDTWYAMAREMGLVVVERVGAFDTLVAARTDTRKAADARLFGATITTYQDFYQRWFRQTTGGASPAPTTPRAIPNSRPAFASPPRAKPEPIQPHEMPAGHFMQSRKRAIDL